MRGPHRSAPLHLKMCRAYAHPWRGPRRTGRFFAEPSNCPFRLANYSRSQRQCRTLIGWHREPVAFDAKRKTLSMVTPPVTSGQRWNLWPGNRASFVPTFARRDPAKGNCSGARRWSHRRHCYRQCPDSSRTRHSEVCPPTGSQGTLHRAQAAPY